MNIKIKVGNLVKKKSKISVILFTCLLVGITLWEICSSVPQKSLYHLDIVGYYSILRKQFPFFKLKKTTFQYTTECRM